MDLAAENTIVQDGAGRGSSSTSSRFPEFSSTLSPLAPGSKKHDEVPKQWRQRLPVHFLLKVS